MHSNTELSPLAAAIAEDILKLTGFHIETEMTREHYDIAVNNPNVKVENVHLGDSLTRLSYKMTNE